MDERGGFSKREEAEDVHPSRCSAFDGAKKMTFFEGRTVFITGASLGVGHACARLFHQAGANLVMVARRLDVLEEAASGLDPLRVLLVAADVLDLSAMRGALEDAEKKFGGVHVLVNNAGAHFRGPVKTRRATELATMVDVNLKAPIALCRMALPFFERAGRGAIVNVASLAGKIPVEGAATYSATKFGLRAFSIALAQELAGSGTTVSVVSPGPVDTGFIMDQLDEVADITFSQKICTADDVAEMVLACAADGRLEREYPKSGAKLATLGYLTPGLRRLIKPSLEKKGRRQKEKLKKERQR
jgi:short-subunit dehydrogenase